MVQTDYIRCGNTVCRLLRLVGWNLMARRQGVVVGKGGGLGNRRGARREGLGRREKGLGKRGRHEEG